MVGKKDHIVVVDMDGTLVRGNTWRYFVAMILRKSLLNLRILTFFRLSILLIKRRIGKISHSELKYSVMRASHLFNGDDWQRFASKMSELFNEDVLRIIETEKENGACILMATAAAGEYAPIIADKAGITYSVFTPKAIEGVLYLELRGEKKADAVEQFAVSHGGEISMIITDHEDDFPLFQRFPNARHLIVSDTIREVSADSGK